MSIVIPMAVIASEAMTEADVIKQLKEAIALYERGWKGAKDHLVIAALFTAIKFRATTMSAEELLKKYLEAEEWQKMKPKNN